MELTHEQLVERATDTMSLHDIVAKEPIVQVVEDLPFPVYKQIPGLNPSTICRRKKSAYCAKWSYEKTTRETDAMVFGRFCHAYLFEPDNLDRDWVIHDGTRRGNGWKESREQAIADGKEIIPSETAKGANVAMELIQSLVKPELEVHLNEGVREVSLFNFVSGMQCKGRLDWVDTKNGVLIDAKFTNDVTPFLFGKSAGNFSYHIKMALYRAWFEQLTGKKINAVKLVAIQTQDEPDVCINDLTDIQLEDGLSQAMELIHKISEDVRTNQFHGVDEGNASIPLDLPHWYMQEETQLDWSE